jgi:Bacterial Ig-like domain (group 3)
MPFFWRGQAHVTNRRRQPVVGSALERLEGRIVMSTATASKVATTTTLQVSQTTAERGQFVPLTATVENAKTGAPVADGVVRFILQGPGHETLGTTRLNKKGQTSLNKGALTRLGQAQIQAMYIPSTTHFATSQSAPEGVTVVPAAVTSFKITSERYRSHNGKPISFTVTALGPNHKPDTNFTGTIEISSPTDNQPVYPPHFYVSLGISAPAPIATGLASIPNAVYTFTPADHGSHTFNSGITFNKGGAEVLMVTQTNNNLIIGKATYGVA